MCGIKSSPTRSMRPNTPVFGTPTGLPITASASSTVESGVDRLDDSDLQPINAEPVRNESRAVLAAHDALAEYEIRAGGHVLGERRIGRRPGHDFQQPHIARRVEEVRDQKIALERVAESLGEQRERNRRGVRGDRGAGLAHGVEFAVQLPA